MAIDPMALLAAFGGGATGLAKSLDDDETSAEAQQRWEAEQARLAATDRANRAMQQVAQSVQLRSAGFHPSQAGNLPSDTDQAMQALIAAGPSTTPSAKPMPSFTMPAPQVAPLPGRSGAASPTLSPADQAMKQLVVQGTFTPPSSRPALAQGTQSFTNALQDTGAPKESFADVNGTPRDYVYNPNDTAAAREAALIDKRQAERDTANEARDAARQTGAQRVAQAAAVAKQQADYNTLKATYPTHALAKLPFDKTNPADYTAALAAARAEAHDVRVTEAGQSRQNWISAGTDPATGHPLILNTRTGETEEGGGVKTGPGSGSASAQSQQARLLAATAEARLADGRMRSFEDQLLSGKKDINVLQQAAGSLMTNLAGSHGITGALGQAGSEAALNKMDPEYAQYLRDAMTIGRAEQMMSPRGGNETMVRANALLSRAGSGALGNTIDASRMARQALFGPSGGVEQSLTPQQSAKLNAGVQQIQSGGRGGAGSGGALKPISDVDRAHAMHDAGFAQWLRDNGYQVP